MAVHKMTMDFRPSYQRGIIISMYLIRIFRNAADVISLVTLLGTVVLQGYRIFVLQKPNRKVKIMGVRLMKRLCVRNRQKRGEE